MWWLDACISAYEIESAEALESSEYVNILKRNVVRYLEDAKRLTCQGLDICSAPDGPSVYMTALEKDLQMIESLSQEDTYAGLIQAFQKVSWMSLKANRDKTVSEDKVQQVKTIRKEVKDLIDGLVPQYFYQDIEGILEDLRVCRPAVSELVLLVREFAERFEAKKRSRNMIDFSDMEQYALKILTEKVDGKLVSSAVAREYKQQYLEIMIDEYQDSNLIQEAIFDQCLYGR